MRSSVLIASAGLALTAGAALADVNLTFHKSASFKIGTRPTFQPRWQDGFPDNTGTADPGPYAYNQNSADLDGQTYFNQGSGNIGAVTTTSLVADDTNTVSYPAGSFVARLYFSFTNGNGNNLAARVRCRFYVDNAGKPGAVVGAFSFSAIGMDAGSINIGYADLTSAFIPLPGTSVKLWAGIVFDNNPAGNGPNNPQGYPVAAAGDMNFFGQATVAPPSPTLGTSTDNVYQTNSFDPGGSGFAVANPGPGSLLDISQFFGPGENLAWGYSIAPTPSTVALLGLGGMIAARRRRQS